MLEANELVVRRKQLKPKEAHPFTELIVELSSFFHRHNLRDDEVESLLELTLNVLHNAGYYHEAGNYRVAQDGDSEWISYLWTDSTPGVNLRMIFPP